MFSYTLILSKLIFLSVIAKPPKVQSSSKSQQNSYTIPEIPKFIPKVKLIDIVSLPQEEDLLRKNKEYYQTFSREEYTQTMEKWLPDDLSNSDSIPGEQSNNQGKNKKPKKLYRKDEFEEMLLIEPVVPTISIRVSKTKLAHILIDFYLKKMYDILQLIQVLNFFVDSYSPDSEAHFQLRWILGYGNLIDHVVEYNRLFCEKYEEVLNPLLREIPDLTNPNSGYFKIKSGIKLISSKLWKKRWFILLLVETPLKKICRQKEDLPIPTI